jgi:anti-sigma factor RsiW
MSDCSSIDPLVTLYVDGELPAADHQAVDEHLHGCPPCRARIIVERAVRDLMRLRQSALRTECAPDALRAKCGAQKARQISEALRAPASAPRGIPARGRFAPLAVAATLLLVVAGASVYKVTESSTRVMAAELTADHVKCFLLQDMIGAEERPASVERALATKFGWLVRLPEQPERAGLELVGERTCLYGQGRVAHIMYRHEGRPVSVFMLPNDARKEEVFDTLGHGAAIWSVGDRTLVVIAREPRLDFDRMARFVRAGLH